MLRTTSALASTQQSIQQSIKRTIEVCRRRDALHSIDLSLLRRDDLFGLSSSSSSASSTVGQVPSERAGQHENDDKADCHDDDDDVRRCWFGGGERRDRPRDGWRGRNNQCSCVVGLLVGVGAEARPSDELRRPIPMWAMNDFGVQQQQPRLRRGGGGGGGGGASVNNNADAVAYYPDANVQYARRQ
jgi:hypothetical protein